MIKTASVLSSVALAVAVLTPELASADVINLNVTVRDFCGQGFGAAACPSGFTPNPDFENGGGDSRGAVQSALGPDGTPVFVGGPTYYGTDTSPAFGTLTAAQYYAQWYHDTPGYNLSTTIALPFTNTGSGVYQYNNSNFFPIDGALLGNEGSSHNYSFTAQLHTTFTYETGQTFDFTGDDDVWVFINKQLAIDLGGVHGAESAALDLDTLGLTAGDTYDFDLFFAERHTVASDLLVSTSIVFDDNTGPTGVPEPSSLAILGGGLSLLMGAAFLRRKKAGASCGA